MSRIVLIILILGSLLTACAGASGPLPHSVYFLDGPEGASQIWRMERDGLTLKQVTAEDAGVDAFAVSLHDGALAFVSGNRLFLVDANGENRRPIADGNLVEATGEEGFFSTEVGSPVFSPDGRTLAYALDGLHLYDLATGEDQHVLTNLGNLPGGPYIFNKEVYAPGPWSPDGRQLLIVMGYYEGSTLAVMEMSAAQTFQRLWTDGTACCLFSWSPDSNSVLVANPYFTTDLPGLWRYDARTGKPVTLVPGLGDDGSLNYAGWPVQLRSGELVFFLANIRNFSPEAGIPLVMTRSEADGSKLTPVRPEAFHVWDALWASDGSLVLIQGRMDDEAVRVFLVRPDDSPLEVLIEEARQVGNLAWGP